MSAAEAQEWDVQEFLLASSHPLIPLQPHSPPIRYETAKHTFFSPTMIPADGSQSSSEHNATSPPTSLRASVEATSDLLPRAIEGTKKEDVLLPAMPMPTVDDTRTKRARSLPLLDHPSRPAAATRRSLSPILKRTTLSVVSLLHKKRRNRAGPSTMPSSTPQLLATEENSIEDESVQRSTPTSRVEADELLQWANRPPSPPQRNLRTRKPAQLAPYTTEMQRYKRRLERNDWQDAVVIQKEFLRAQKEKRREREENGLSPVPGEEAEKRPRSNATGKQRRMGEGGDGIRSRKRTTPLTDRVNTDYIVERYGGLPSSSSEAEEENRSQVSGPSRRLSASSSTTSQEARVPSRKRYRRALLSETESSSVEVLEISDDSSTQSDASETSITEQPFIVSDDDDDQGRDGRGKEKRLSVKDMRYYKQQLKLARRTMPMAAAKKCIDDLMLMHRERRDGNRGREPTPDDAEDDIVEMPSSGSLRPGESRTRIVHQRDGEHAKLVDDADEESDDPNMPSPVTSDTETEGEVGRNWMYDEDLPSERWLHSVGRGRRDDIDRMLTSATRRTGANRGKDRATGVGKKRRQTKLVLEGKAGPTKTAYRDGAYAKNGSGIRGQLRETLEASTRRKRRKRRRNDVNTTISKVYYGPSAGRLPLENPPIAQVRNKPRFSLLHDAVLFEGMSSSPSPVADGQNTPVSSLIATPSKYAPGYMHGWQLGKVSRSPASRSSSSSPVKAAYHDKGPPSGVSPGQPIRPFGVNRPNPPRPVAPPAPLVQKRLDLQPKTPSTTEASPAHLIKQRAQMDIWQDVSDLRLDFGLRPPPAGLSFHADTPLGKGRLFELLQLVKGTEEHIKPRSMCVFNSNLAEDTFDGRELQDALDAANEQLVPFLHSDGQSGAEAKFPTCLSDLCRFTCLWLTASQDDIKARNVVRIARSYVEDFLATIKDNKNSKGPHHSALLQALRWFKVELSWREACHLLRQDKTISLLNDAYEADWQSCFVRVCQELMLELLIHGLHHTMQSIKRASQVTFDADDPTGYFTLDDAILTDQSAQYWIGIIHLLNAEEATEMMGAFTSFWTIFETATKQYQSALSHTKSGLVVAENGWFSIMAICTLGYFTASTGASTSRTSLKGGHWPMVMQTLSHVRLRADEEVEAAMPRAALQLRDDYIRLTLCRALHLHTIWGWSYESCEATLGKLFALFDSHKLEDLPTEASPDFPSFLRSYDESLLLDAVQEEDSAFHIFIKILARAAHDLRASNHSDERQADRNVARLFSRFSPLRTMTFNRELPPTTLERSALFNHYSIALVYLHLVPSSHHQRLLQIQQYLFFSKADDKSQLVCIRAMMYAITVLQHHSIDIKEAIGWFKGAFKMLVSRLEELHRTGASSGHLMKWDKDIKTQKTLVITALRSLQYVIKFESLDKHNTAHGYPSVLLLDATWTANLLQSQLAVQSTSLTLEVFHLLQAFLARRLSAVTVEKKKASSTTSDQNGESQDSFADLFDDIDFDDALLMDAAGYHASDSAQHSSKAEEKEKIRQADRDFAMHLHSCISPAMFQLLSNLFHPARHPPFSMARTTPDQLQRREPGYLSMLNSVLKEMGKTSLAETIIDTWALCAWIMVEETEVRQWSHYFNYGLEDPKRLQGEVAKRDVTLHFLLFISSKCLAQIKTASSSSKMYEANRTDFWSCFMASLSSRNLTSQHLMCNNLRQLEWARDAAEGGLLRGMDWQDKTSWTVEDFERNRINLLGVILANFNAAWQEARLASKSLLFASLTSLLVSVRTYIAEDKNGKDADHLAFCNAVVQCCNNKLSDTLLRGVAAELRKTLAFLEGQGQGGPAL